MHSQSHPDREARGGCGCRSRRAFDHTEHHHYPGEELAGGFGIRRPLRFLAWKLELDDTQVPAIAAILNELKTERAQAAVDDRRALTLLADAAATEPFDATKASEAARLRARSTEQLQQKVVEALARMVETLRPEQRQRLAYLLRTGTLLM